MLWPTRQNVWRSRTFFVKALTRDDLLDLLGLELGPVRVKCALLSLKVLKAGVYGLGEASDDLIS